MSRDAMAIQEESWMRGDDDPRRLVEIVDRALQDSFGIDPISDHDDVCALATTGLVVSCWRNTVLESIHAGGYVSNARRGSYARDGIPDRDMARMNVATWRQVRPHVHPDVSTLLAVRARCCATRAALYELERARINAAASSRELGPSWHGISTRVHGCRYISQINWVATTRQLCGTTPSAVGAMPRTGFGNPWWGAAVEAWSEQEPPNNENDLISRCVRRTSSAKTRSTG